MVFALPRAADEERVNEAVIRKLDGARFSYVLAIGGEDFSGDVSSEQGEWGTDGSGINYADLVLTRPLPRRLEGAPVAFSVVVDGVAVPQLVGVDSLSEIGEDRASTDPFQARSAGGLANENTLDEQIECEGWFPEEVVRKALSKLPYARGGVRVEPLKEPVLYFTRAGGNDFKPEQHPSDMLSAVQEKAPYLYRDTYSGGARASMALALGRAGAPVRSYSADEIAGSGDGEQGKGFRPPPRTEPRYSRVVVFGRNPDDSYAFWAECPVSHRGQAHQPRSRTYYVQLEDPTGNGPARAQNLAYDLAARLARGVYADELVLPALDPLLERGDSFAVDGIFREREGERGASYQRSYLCQAKAIKNATDTLLATVGYEALLVFEERLAVPTLALSGLSTGVSRSPWGEYWDYFWLDESLPWVTDNGDYFTINDAASGGVVTDSGDYFTVN